MTTAAQTLSSEDRAEVDRSNDWQTLLTKHLPNLTQRNEIANIIRTATPPTPAPPPGPTPAPPPGPTPAPGAITPQDFVDSVSLVGPTAPVPATGPTLPVTLTPQSVHANPSVAISSQVTVTPAASVRGTNVSPAALWPNAATTGVAATPTIAVTGPVSLDAQLALVNGPVGLTRTSPIPPVRFTIDDQRQTGFAAGWQPGVEFNNGAFQDTFVAGTSTPRYVGGAQTIGVKGTMPVAPNQNPGLTLSVRARIERGGTIIAPSQTTAYPANAAESTLVTFSIAPPTPMPAAGDTINVISDLVDAAGTTVAGSARTVAMTIGAEAVYTQAAAETVWNDDETFLHGAFLSFLTANGGAAAGLAGLVRTAANPTGQIQIHPMVQRHDSAAYVALANGGTPDPSQSAYVITAPQLVAAYDLAQPQAVLLRAVRVIVEVESAIPGAYRTLFHKLKFLHLLCAIAPRARGGYRIEIDGPFSLFESSTRYGRRHARPAWQGWLRSARDRDGCRAITVGCVGGGRGRAEVYRAGKREACQLVSGRAYSTHEIAERTPSAFTARRPPRDLAQDGYADQSALGSSCRMRTSRKLSPARIRVSHHQSSPWRKRI